MRTRSGFQIRTAALATAAILALGAAACGGSDDDDGGGDSGNDQQQARATVENLYAAIRDGDAEEVCQQLNEDAQKQLAQGGLGAKTGSCADSFQKFLDQAEKAGGLNLTLKAKVKSVEVSGDKAVAKISFGGKGREGEIPLEKIDGEWKLAAAGATPSQ